MLVRSSSSSSSSSVVVVVVVVLLLLVLAISIIICIYVVRMYIPYIRNIVFMYYHSIYYHTMIVFSIIVYNRISSCVWFYTNTRAVGMLHFLHSDL
jgi:hypothetical protein